MRIPTRFLLQVDKPFPACWQMARNGITTWSHRAPTSHFGEPVSLPLTPIKVG
jgi:hypothetical protein